MTRDMVKAADKLTPEEFAIQVSPLGRSGNAEDAAGCILWLASRTGSWLSGMVVVMDGGKLGTIPSTY